MKCTKGLDQTKFLQISSDGPNVNLAFLHIINNHRAEVELNQLILYRYLWASHHNSFCYGEEAGM